MKTSISSFICIVLLILIISPMANAVGIITDFIEDGTIMLSPGDSRLYGVRIQNPESSDAVVTVTYDSTYLSLLEEQERYTIPAKGQAAFTFNVSAPENSAPKDKFLVQYTIHTPGGAGDGVGINVNIAKGFYLEIIREEGMLYPSDFAPIVIALIIIMVVGVILYNWKNESKGNKALRKQKKYKRK